MRYFCGFFLGLFPAILVLLVFALPADASGRRHRSVPVKAETATLSPIPMNMPVAVGADLTEVEGATRLTFTLSKPVDARIFTLENPDRIIIELPEVNFQIGPDSVRKGAGLIATYRYGLFAANRSRVVIDLTQPALATASSATLGQSSTVSVQLLPVDRETFAASIRNNPPPKPPAAIPTFQVVRDTRPIIMIDPGHGGVDPGAVGGQGVAEKTLVLAFAAQLKDTLSALGGYRVFMTRETDTFVSLEQRVQMARESHADLLISIHADTLSDPASVQGATVYTGSESASDAEAARLAEKENRADAVAGVALPAATDAVSDILSDLMLRETRAFSNRLAKRMVADLPNAMKMNKNPHRSAGFYVLKSPDVPSVLVELGYLSNPQDVALLQSQAWREKSTAAMTAAIDRYFRSRENQSENASVSP